jgi:hypothetical protein
MLAHACKLFVYFFCFVDCTALQKKVQVMIISFVYLIYHKEQTKWKARSSLHVDPVPGSLDKKRGKTVPSFSKQRWNIDGIFRLPFLSNEPGTVLKYLLTICNGTLGIWHIYNQMSDVSIVYSNMCFVLKGPWHEIFDLWFCSSNNFPYAPDHGFSNIDSNSRRNSTKLLHNGVNDTALHVTAVPMTLLCISQRCKFYNPVHITAVSFTPLCNQLCRISSRMIRSTVFYMRKSVSAAHGTTVSLTPLWHAQQCQWYRFVIHSGISDTAVTLEAVLLTPLWHAQQYQWHCCANRTPLWLLDPTLERLWLPLKGISMDKTLHYLYL